MGVNDLAARVLSATAQPPVDEEDAITTAILDAALQQFEQFGMAKSTMDDVARRADVSRVTIYRRFAGKDALVDAVMVREIQRHHSALLEAVAPFEDPREQIVEGFVFNIRAIRAHRLLQRLLVTEPEALVPHLTTQGGPLIAFGRAFLAARMASQPEDGRSDEERLVRADIVTRLLVSYVITPDPPVDFDDVAAARRFAATFLAPILVGR